jgi:hypothetical protein
MREAKKQKRPGLIHYMMSLAMLVIVSCIPPALAVEESQTTNSTQVLEAFDRQQVQRVNQASELSDHNKHLIMFLMGVPLLILLLITGGLGIATGIFGKQLFIAHMIFAGLTITLALAHVIVGLVWFYPF